MAAPDNEPVAYVPTVDGSLACAACSDVVTRLRIPAILQNPVNRTQKQVEAHNAQQREKVEAKRERVREVRYDTGSKGDKRGKRVIRRSDNGDSIPFPLKAGLELVLRPWFSCIRFESAYRPSVEVRLCPSISHDVAPSLTA